MQLSTNMSLCETYENERTDPLWEDLIDDELHREPKCGHAIDYLRSNCGTELAVKTTRNYAGVLDFFVEFLHDRDTSVVAAELRDIRDFKNVRERQNLAVETIKMDITAVVNLYKHISLYRDAETNVSPDLIRAEITPSGNQEEDRRHREPLSKDEIRKLFEATENLRELSIIQTLLETGMRNSSFTELHEYDVDLDAQEIKIKNVKSGGTYTLPISDQLTLYLRRWLTVERPAMGPADDNDYLFPSRNGGQLTVHGLRHIVDRVARRAGIQEVARTVPLSEKQQEYFGTESDTRNEYRVDVHTLRHTFNHLLDDAGIPKEARSAALDHDNTEVTAEYYDHGIDEHHQILREQFSGVSNLIPDNSGSDDDTPGSS